MIACKGCGREYDIDDCPDLQPPGYGWDASYGECFLCFCWAMFSGDLEPPEGFTDWRPYEIKAPAHRHW